MRKHTYYRGITLFPPRDELRQRPSLSSFRFRLYIPNRNQRVWDVRRRQSQCITHYLRAEQWRAHPARVKSQLIGCEKHILHTGAKTLDRHRRLGFLSLFVGIAIQIVGYQRNENERGRLKHASSGSGQTS